MDIRNKELSSLESTAVKATDSEIEIKPDMEKLHAYTKVKLALAGQLRIVREALRALGREDGEGQCGELIVKLAEDRFTLAVLGQFKRGKSSLMNAIIGRELLPTGVLPLTSAITVLKFGPVERLVVNRENSIFPEEMPVAALTDYVTEKGNPGNRKKVKTACVELPVPFLRRGVEFVDTPGVGSAITANTITTYEFLPECDAVLFVTSVDTPLTSVELEFLKAIREYVNKIFFVVNKIDLVGENERSEVLGFVSETIRSQIGCGKVRVFPVSARQGLAARTSGNAALYEQSGLKALEEALAFFLSEEKAAAFLAALTHKALKILENEAGQDAFAEAALQARAKALQQDKTGTLQRDPHAAVEAVIAARAKLEALQEGILNGCMLDKEYDVLPSSAAQKKVMTETIAAPIPMVEDLTADLKVRGCPVCRHIAKAALDFFAHWQYQISSEERAQGEFAVELGFCPLHTWQLLAVSSPHGASVGYARLAAQVARRLREKPQGDAVRQLVRHSRNCRVCELLRRVEGEYIKRLAAMIAETTGRNLYRHSQGVCLRHLGMLMDTVVAESHEFLLAHAAQQFEEDVEDMQSYAIKHEAIRRALQNRNEEDAYRRTIIRIVGERSVCAPWAEDKEI